MHYCLPFLHLFGEAVNFFANKTPLRRVNFRKSLRTFKAIYLRFIFFSSLNFSSDIFSDDKRFDDSRKQFTKEICIQIFELIFRRFSDSIRVIGRGNFSEFDMN